MKTIIIILYGMKTGGAELQFLELAERLNKNSNLNVIGIKKNGDLGNLFIQNEIQLKIYDFKSRIKILPLIFLALKRIRSIKPDTIISTSFICNLVTFLSSYTGNHKLIAFQTISKSMTKYKRIEKMILRKFDYIVAGSKSIEDYLVDMQIERTKILQFRNWVDFSKREYLVEKHYLIKKFKLNNSQNKDEIIIGAISRLVLQKGHIYLLEALTKLSEFNIRLYLIGDGEERNKLLNYCIDNSLVDKVYFIGNVENEYYNTFFELIDIFVLPSIYEGLPRTLLDAMYFKKPIVATNVDGNKEVIRHNVNGFLVNPGSPEELANAIKILLADRDFASQLGQAAQATIYNEYNLDNRFDKLISIL